MACFMIKQSGELFNPQLIWLLTEILVIHELNIKTKAPSWRVLPGQS